MPEYLNRDDYAPHLNSKFRFYFTPEISAEMELVEVSELRSTPRYEAFSLLFVAPHDAPLIQQMYQAEHSALGSFEIFLVPLGTSERGVEYEAVFNRLVVK